MLSATLKLFGVVVYVGSNVLKRLDDRECQSRTPSAGHRPPPYFFVFFGFWGLEAEIIDSL